MDISIGYMQNHLERPLYPGEPGISQLIYLFRIIQQFSGKKTGYSPVIYFNHLKIQHACQYLQFTTLRVNEIALKLGIEDPYYFSRYLQK